MKYWGMSRCVDFWAVQGATREHTPRGSVPEEQRRTARKAAQPSGRVHLGPSGGVARSLPYGPSWPRATHPNISTGCYPYNATYFQNLRNTVTPPHAPSPREHEHELPYRFLRLPPPVNSEPDHSPPWTPTASFIPAWGNAPGQTTAGPQSAESASHPAPLIPTQQACAPRLVPNPASRPPAPPPW